MVADGSSVDSPTEINWWIPIGVIAILVPIGTVLSFVLPPDVFSSLFLMPILGVGLIGAILSPLFIHLDRKQLRESDKWVPSIVYFLMPLPPLVLLLPIAYIYQRHKHIGSP